MTATPVRWLACGQHELPDDLGWLTAREAERAAGMRFTKRRTEYLLRRWVGKRAVALAGDSPLAPTELARIEVANRPTGEPYVLIDGQAPPLTVSLTDRAGWAVCLVGQDPTRVGCDLEIVEPRSSGFLADFLTAPERAYVAAQPDDMSRHAAANLLWSAKESALKVLGTGLRRDARSVAVTVEGAGPGGWSRLSVATEDGDVLPGWWRREDDFLLTVAADRPVRPPTELPRSAAPGTPRFRPVS